MFNKIVSQSIYFYNGDYEIKTLDKKYNLKKVVASGYVRLNLATILLYPQQFTFDLISDRRNIFELEDSVNNPASFHYPTLSNMVKWDALWLEPGQPNPTYLFSLDFDCDVSLDIGEKLSFRMAHITTTIQQANSQGQLNLFLEDV